MLASFEPRGVTQEYSAQRPCVSAVNQGEKLMERLSRRQRESEKKRREPAE
jgi:hypothetical protein